MNIYSPSIIIYVLPLAPALPLKNSTAYADPSFYDECRYTAYLCIPLFNICDHPTESQ